MKTISRTITTYTFKVYRVTIDNNGAAATERMEDMVFHKLPTPTEINKVLTAKYPGVRCVVGDGIVNTATYTMSIEKFIENADSVEEDDNV